MKYRLGQIHALQKLGMDLSPFNKTVGKGALIGGLIGGGTGLVAPDELEEGEDPSTNRLLSGLAGAGSGALRGGIYGYGIHAIDELAAAGRASAMAQQQAAHAPVLPRAPVTTRPPPAPMADPGIDLLQTFLEKKKNELN